MNKNVGSKFRASFGEHILKTKESQEIVKKKRLLGFRSLLLGTDNYKVFRTDVNLSTVVPNDSLQCLPNY